jgi:hypothetical protein
MKPPRVVGVVLCKSFDIDRAAGDLTLSGVFHTLEFAEWPTPFQHFVAYSALHGGEGEGTMELVVTHLESEEGVYRYRRWYTVPDLDLVIHLEMRIRRCSFPLPGRYGLSLRFNGEELSYRPLDVRPQRGEE